MVPTTPKLVGIAGTTCSRTLEIHRRQTTALDLVIFLGSVEVKDLTSYKTYLIMVLDSVILNPQTCIPNQLNNEFPQLYIFVSKSVLKNLL